MCQNCGTSLKTEARFCNRCGASVVASQIPTPLPNENGNSPLPTAHAVSLDPDRSTYARSTRPIPEVELGGIQREANVPPLVVPPVPEPYSVPQRYVPRWMWVMLGMQWVVIVALVLLIVFVLV